MIDLHCHTDQSDGTCSPAELVALAKQTGVTALGITDHDTFLGWEQAVPHALAHDVELVCGIELSTKYEGQTAHLLAYFLEGLPEETRAWVAGMRLSRDERNRQLIQRLQQAGVAITLDEVQSKSRTMTGRPHFAQILVEKNYVASIQEAFDKFLDKSACCYVERDEPQLLFCIQQVRAQGGIASLAHPCRLDVDLERVLPKLCESGLGAIEAYHSDHTASQTEFYRSLARKHGLLLTGGSDFHGALKAGISLGTGRDGNLRVPDNLLAQMREHTRSAATNRSLT